MRGLMAAMITTKYKLGQTVKVNETDIGEIVEILPIGEYRILSDGEDFFLFDDDLDELNKEEETK
jgi:hypothetical protein